MLFNSTEFIFIFLPLVFFVYYFLNKYRLVELAKGWLVVASLVFYAYWKVEYLPLILISMVFNYSIGTTLTQENNLKINRKMIFILGILGNVLLLGYFKYFDFLLYNLNRIFSADFNYMHLILPLGISFFTFQQIAYLADSYKKETREYDFLNYALFVTFFPQLVAGPIVHHREMMPQFANLRNKIINHKNITTGLVLFTIGLAKKILIADNLSEFVVYSYSSTSAITCVQAWLASLSYTFQLYFDFSGYTDMALGIGYLFNIVLPQNFNSPYRAWNIQEFWRRWHMTLSRFLKDYIYIPLGGNRFGKFNTYKNLFLTFLIGGIWHGAAWTFVIWGALHGIAAVIHRVWKNINSKIFLPKWISIALTFVFVDCTWVFFRAPSVHDAINVFKGMIGLNGLVLPRTYGLNFHFVNSNVPLNWLLLLVCIIFIFVCKNSSVIAKKFKPNYLTFILLFATFLYSVLNINKISEFLYFQF